MSLWACWEVLKRNEGGLIKNSCATRGRISDVFIAMSLVQFQMTAHELSTQLMGTSGCSIKSSRLEYLLLSATGRWNMLVEIDKRQACENAHLLEPLREELPPLVGTVL